MARTITDPNPHLSILDGDGQVKKQIAEQAERSYQVFVAHWQPTKPTGTQAPV